MDTIYSFLSEGMDRRPAYGFSHRLRASVEKDQITPSPLDYHAEKVSLGPSTKSYSFGHRPRTNIVRDYDTPGPGEYFIAEEVPVRRRSGYSFGSKPHPSTQRSFTPGPKYMPNDVGSFQPSRGFSFGHRSKGRKFSVTPGPGEYEWEKFVFKDTPAYSFGVKNHMRGRNDFFRNITPAPLDYRPEAKSTKTSPAYSFGTQSRGRIFMPKDLDLPGPGEYNTNCKSFSKNEKGFSFGLRLPTLIK